MSCIDKSLVVKGVLVLISINIISISTIGGLAVLVGVITGTLLVPDELILAVGVFAILVILGNIPTKRLWDYYKRNEMVESILIATIASLLSLLIVEPTK